MIQPRAMVVNIVQNINEVSDARVLDNSLRADSTFCCRRRLLSSGCYWYCYTSISSQIDSPAIGYVKDTAEYIDIKYN